jgi:arylsulfatase
MKTIQLKCSGWRSLALLIVMVMSGHVHLFAQKKPNIVFIMGDDVGWFNIGAYHQGMMAGKTPNLDKLASEGMRFTAEE